jgi:hypothetical protein
MEQDEEEEAQKMNKREEELEKKGRIEVKLK